MRKYFFNSAIMLRFGETKVATQKFYTSKKWYVFGMLILII